MWPLICYDLFWNSFVWNLSVSLCLIKILCLLSFAFWGWILLNPSLAIFLTNLYRPPDMNGYYKKGHYKKSWFISDILFHWIPKSTCSHSTRHRFLDFYLSRVEQSLQGWNRFLQREWIWYSCGAVTWPQGNIQCCGPGIDARVHAALLAALHHIGIHQEVTVH